MKIQLSECDVAILDPAPADVNDVEFRTDRLIEVNIVRDEETNEITAVRVFSADNPTPIFMVDKNTSPRQIALYPSRI